MFHISGGEVLAMLTILASVCIAALLVVLKLSGVLLMGWLAIGLIVPGTFLLVCLLAIIRNL